MLTGRESLSRLVGKRRKFLPNRHSLLSSSIKGPSNPCQDNKDGATRFEAEGPSQRCLDGGIEISPPPGWVTCPVCGNAICGEDRVINSHLDTCLRRGTKRKWRQCNLPQINFCESTKVETCLHEEIDVQKSHKNNFASDKSCNLHSCFGIEQNDSRACKSFLDSESVSCNDGSAGNLIGNNTVDLPSSLLVNQLMKYEKSESSNDIYRMALKTFIVGHRFGDKIEFNSGQIITLSRDPNNVKDCNAIKVLSADSGDKLLGFLPRELAQYLSPLIDKYHLRFQGSVTSVPNCSMDAIPIQILCQFGMPFGEIECEDLQEVMSLWKSALCVAKSTENCPPNTARYQKNFTLLLQEVLRSYSYLFSYDEKIFLESFFSLPDDSQRLFIRLYTRKGPWFRMSSICYPEVFDCKQGIEGLSATGFVCLVGCVSELLDSDLKDIFNLLTVSEIREILCHLKKKCNFGTRKQDFIALLLSSYADGSCPLLPKLVLEKTGTCIQISSRAESLAWRCERLFFLNGEQDLSAFLLVDLGIVRYPTYSCVVSKKIFSGRSDLLAYEEAIEVAQMMDQALDDNNAELVFQCMEISDSKIFMGLLKGGFAGCFVP
ncbi:Phosphodiesterase I [Bertholletia excelsa]